MSSISNAIVNLGTADLSKLDTWLSKFQKLNKKAKTIQELFDAGKITAWACGMAQFRQKALEICKHLETELLEIALGISNIRSINRDNDKANVKEYNFFLNNRIGELVETKERI